MKDSPGSGSAYYVLFILILAGEGIFILPFVLARVFRPTFLEVFDINNFQLGTCFSIYGIVALLSYYWGGTLADRFKPGILMALALLLTAAGGLVLATYPGYTMMKVIYGYWGFTTIFLFWGAMIKATRLWGGIHRQGRAFGFLDGGRGLVGAAMGSMGVLIFASFIGEDSNLSTLAERRAAFRNVIIFTVLTVCLTAVLVWLLMKQQGEETPSQKNSIAHSLSNFRTLIKIPTVFWLMIIILCAYVGYKITDVFSLFANEVMLYDQVASAKVGTFLLYIRPVIGVTIGVLADRSQPSVLIITGFVLMLLGAIIVNQ